MEYTWSYSSLKDYLNCPKQYHQVKVIRAYEKEPNSMMLYGTAVHKACEDYVASDTPLPENYKKFQSTLDALKSIPGTKYTLAFLCNAPGAIAALPGTNGVQRYLVLNRLDTNTTNFPDETSQAYRDGAGGLVGTTTATQSCFLINATETIWASATPSACNAARLPAVTGSVLCGFATRFDSNLATTCASTVVSVDSLTPAYTQDTDVNDVDNYTDYVGNGRRLITVPIVDALSATGTMTVLGFRQFLILPTQGSTNIVPGDTNGRFPAMYVGTVAPLKQGRFDGCQITNGPGKVVLHQ